MSRNFLKGVAGDVMNLLLAAAAFNFKRAMNALLCFILKCLLTQKTESISVATSITKENTHFLRID